MFTSTHARSLIFGLLLVGASAFAGERVKPTIDQTTFKVEVTWTDEAGIKAAAFKYHVRIDEPLGAGRIGPKAFGFSALVRRGDEVICRIWAVKPWEVDDQKTTSLGHELAHCLLGEYHR